jgi:hypothetical protein
MRGVHEMRDQLERLNVKIREAVEVAMAAEKGSLARVCADRRIALYTGMAHMLEWVLEEDRPPDQPLDDFWQEFGKDLDLVP